MRIVTTEARWPPGEANKWNGVHHKMSEWFTRIYANAIAQHFQFPLNWVFAEWLHSLLYDGDYSTIADIHLSKWVGLKQRSSWTSTPGVTCPSRAAGWTHLKYSKLTKYFSPSSICLVYSTMDCSLSFSGPHLFLRSWVRLPPGT